jgi:hypothetical protein
LNLLREHILNLQQQLYRTHISHGPLRVKGSKVQTEQMYSGLYRAVAQQLAKTKRIAVLFNRRRLEALPFDLGSIASRMTIGK